MSQSADSPKGFESAPISLFCFLALIHVISEQSAIDRAIPKLDSTTGFEAYVLG